MIGCLSGMWWWEFRSKKTERKNRENGELLMKNLNAKTAIMENRQIKERPILFSGDMVKAILEGRKKQTRRVIKLPKWSTGNWSDFEVSDDGKPLIVCKKTGCLAEIPCPYGQPGDQLWVKETWWDHKERPKNEHGVVYYDCDQLPSLTKDKSRWLHEWYKKRPSRFMPRWASRINLEILSIRVERLQDMDEFGAIAEGANFEMNPVTSHMSTKYGFMNLWDSINYKKYPWGSNPWVRVIEFKVLEVVANG